MPRSLVVAGALSAAFLSGPALAELNGEKQILLSGHGDQHVALGSVTFNGDGSYAVAFDDHLFSEHFLSMRPFKCMTGPQDMWCHLPYPYEKKGRINGQDLADLEYDLLFIHRKAADYGIDAWNGLYYQLSVDGDALVGELREVDLNILAAPPEDGDLRPIGPADLNDADPVRHWLSRIEIR